MQRISIAFLSVCLLTLACDRSSGGETVAPEDTTQQQPEPEFDPGPTSDWGDGKVIGVARLAWGDAPPADSTMRVTFWRNGDRVQDFMVPLTGAGPWAFEFTAQGVESFDPADTFGLGAMIEVPPDSEAWYMGDPPSIQIWKAGEAGGVIELKLIPIDPRVAGEGPG